MSDSTFAYAYSGQVIAAGVVLPLVGLMCLILRFVARIGEGNRLGIDDWLMIPSLLFVIGMGVCMVIGAARKVMGFPAPPSPSSDSDQDTEFLPGEELLEKLEYAFYIFMILAYGFIKLSVLYFYRRIFVAGMGRFNIVSNVVIAIVVLWTVGFLLVQIFSCGSHFNYNWGPLVDQLSCVAGLQYLEGLMISDFVTDLLVFFLPFGMIWRLHVPIRRKAVVTGTLLLGAASLAASAARLVLQIQQTRGGYAAKTDIFLSLTTILYWSMIEAGIATIAICLPAMQNLSIQKSVQSFIAGVRKAALWDSLRAHHSGQSSKNTRAQRNKRAEVYGVYGGTVDAAIAEMESQAHMPQPMSAAHVKEDFSPADDIV